MRRVVLLLLAAAAAAGPERAEVTARVTYLVPEGAYVDAGTEQGLAAGETGTVLRDGKPVAKAEVVAASSRSARVRVFDGEARLDDLVRFEAVAAPAPPPDAGAKRPEPAEPFVPLLERQKSVARAEGPRNVSHGWIAVDQLVQTGSFDDYWRTSLSSSGDVQRLFGEPWAVDWSFRLSGRGGDAFEGLALEGARLDVFELALSRRLGEEGVLRLGRFVPRALPAIGYVDGALVEQRISPHVRGGAILGFAPSGDDLAPSADAPLVALYTTLHAGDRRGDRFTGSFGVLGSLFEGDRDRLAALFDLFATVGRLDLSADGVVDFDAGSRAFTSGTTLTQGNVDATLRVAEGTRLRAGADRFENPDTAAFRAALPVVDPLLFEGSGWRYHAGATQSLPARLTLDVQVAWIDAPDTGDVANWFATLTRHGDAATVSLSVYGLEGLDVGGVGGRLSAYVPMGRLTLRGGVGFTAFDPDGVESFEVTDADLHASYVVSPRWTVQGGVRAAVGDGADHVAVDLGLAYRW